MFLLNKGDHMSFVTVLLFISTLEKCTLERYTLSYFYFFFLLLFLILLVRHASVPCLTQTSSIFNNTEAVICEITYNVTTWKRKLQCYKQWPTNTLTITRQCVTGSYIVVWNLQSCLNRSELVLFTQNILPSHFATLPFFFLC